MDAYYIIYNGGMLFVGGANKKGTKGQKGAIVACRQLGYPNDNPTVWYNGYASAGSITSFFCEGRAE